MHTCPISQPTQLPELRWLAQSPTQTEKRRWQRYTCKRTASGSPRWRDRRQCELFLGSATWTRVEFESPFAIWFVTMGRGEVLCHAWSYRRGVEVKREWGFDQPTLSFNWTKLERGERQWARIGGDRRQNGEFRQMGGVIYRGESSVGFGFQNPKTKHDRTRAVWFRSGSGFVRVFWLYPNFAQPYCEIKKKFVF